MYAIVRRDLNLSPGAAAAQAGHAILDTFLSASLDSQQVYRSTGGTKIVLSARDEHHLLHLLEKAKSLGLNCCEVTETDPPLAVESPVRTAIGIGPVPRDLARPVTRKLSLMK